MTPADNCKQCEHKNCELAISHFHYQHLGITSTTLINGEPAQQSLWWEFLEFAIEHCFEVRSFRVMLFYGLYENDLPHFLKETEGLTPLTVINFLRRTHQVMLKLTEDFKHFRKHSGQTTTVTDLIPNLITIIQMKFLQLVQSYLAQHASDQQFSYTITDIIQ